MTDAILALVPSYGLPLLALIVMLSCLALPVPSSLVMLTSGSFVGAGDLGFAATFATAFFAAMAGDQIGFHLGRWGGTPLLERLSRNDDRRALIARAQTWLDRRAGSGIFLTRWLFSPLGPYVNFIGGATGLAWARFTAWGALGEVVWVSLYIGLGIVFAEDITAVAELAGDLSGFLAAGAVTLFLGWRVAAVLRRMRREAAQGGRQ